MQPHKVIAEFLYRRERISPPGKWTPPNEETAQRLIAARCLRPIPQREASPVDDGAESAGDGSGETLTPLGPADVGPEASPAAAEPDADPKPRRGRKGK